MWGNIAISFLLAFIVSFMATPYSIKIAEKIGAIDIPKDDRRMRKKSIPKLGGLAVIAGFAISLIYLISVMNIEGSINLFDENSYFKKLIGVGLGVIIITITGVIDDTKTLKPLQKLFGQVLAAMVAVAFGIQIDSADIPFITNVELANEISMIVTVIWIVGITNAVNFIDGIDGLAGSIVSICALAIGIVSLVLEPNCQINALMAFILMGAMCAFLTFNYNPAKIFMGDSGALYSGFMLATLSITGIVKPSLGGYTMYLPILILAVPLMDIAYSSIRRIMKGSSPFVADAEHIHHKLLHAGYSQDKLVLLLAGFSMVCALLSIIVVSTKSKFIIIALSLIGVLILLNVISKLIKKSDEPTEEQN